LEHCVRFKEAAREVEIGIISRGLPSPNEGDALALTVNRL